MDESEAEPRRAAAAAAADTAAAAEAAADPITDKKSQQEAGGSDSFFTGTKKVDIPLRAEDAVDEREARLLLPASFAPAAAPTFA